MLRPGDVGPGRRSTATRRTRRWPCPVLFPRRSARPVPSVPLPYARRDARWRFEWPMLRTFEFPMILIVERRASVRRARAPHDAGYYREGGRAPRSALRPAVNRLSR